MNLKIYHVNSVYMQSKQTYMSTSNKTYSKSTQGAKRKVLKVTPSNFDVKKFYVPREVIDRQTFGKGKDYKQEQKQSSQYTLFPKYKYSQSSGEGNSKVEAEEDTLCILTDPIHIGRGGLLKVDDNYRKSDDDCTAIWIPLQKEHGGNGAVTLEEMLSNVDKYFDKKISDNKEFLVLKNGNSEEAIDFLSYIPLVREAEKPPGAKDFVPWLRTKVRIPFKEVKCEDGTLRKEIDVKLIVPDENGETDENGEIIKVKKTTTSITELRKDFTYGCTAQFYLKIKTFWALKTAKSQGKNKTRDCGFKITCEMINITKRSDRFQKQDYDWDDVLDDDESPQQTVKNDTKPDDDSDSDASEKNDKQSKTKETKQQAKVTKQQAKKNKGNDNSDSDSDDGSNSDSDDSDKSEDDEPIKSVKPSKSSKTKTK